MHFKEKNSSLFAGKNLQLVSVHLNFDMCDKFDTEGKAG